jgi:hypothetical protein
LVIGGRCVPVQSRHRGRSRDVLQGSRAPEMWAPYPLRRFFLTYTVCPRHARWQGCCAILGAR